MLDRIPLITRRLDAYAPMTEAALLTAVRLAAGDLAGARVLHVTGRRSGAEAERARALAALDQGLGLVADWRVLPADDRVRSATRALRARLRGLDAAFDRDARAWWLEHWATQGTRLQEEYDFVFAYGVDTVGLLAMHGARDTRWVWSADLDLSRALPDAWGFLSPFLRDCDSVVVPNRSFAPPDFGPGRVVCMAPAIDPFALQNLAVPAGLVQDVVAALGLDPARPFVAMTSTPGADARDAVAALRLLRRERADLQLAVVLVADPCDARSCEDATTLLTQWGDEPGAQGFLSTGIGGLEIGILQRAARVFVVGHDDDAVSSAAEAMWKAVPVIAPVEMAATLDGAAVPCTGGPEAIAAAVLDLLEDAARAARIGAAGTQHVRRNSLLPRLLHDQLELMRSLALRRPLAIATTEDTDPVCGMPVGAKDSAGEATFERRTYRFCSPSCRRQFVADPARYVRRPLGATPA